MNLPHLSYESLQKKTIAICNNKLGVHCQIRIKFKLELNIKMPVKSNPIMCKVIQKTKEAMLYESILGIIPWANCIARTRHKSISLMFIQER